EGLDAGRLSWDSTYYWRVDEVNDANPDSPWTGAVWSFATGAFLVVDDFESYDDIDPAPGEPGLNRIFDKWIDGFGTLTNGALVGNDLPPYAERTIVHSGAQSMNYVDELCLRQRRQDLRGDFDARLAQRLDRGRRDEAQPLDER
ncbi:MAG: hypothetical protein AMJ65_12260, partial [Phycisphaerae bacterium SG8_4]